MQLEGLKELVMKQAAEKGFGTCPEDISVAEKLILAADEVREAGVDIKELKLIRQESRDFWCDRWEETGDFPWGLLLVGKGFLYWKDHTQAGKKVSNYETEWGDLLQRILHLGGVYNIVFPDAEFCGPVYTRADCERTERAYGLVLAAYDHYRHKKMKSFADSLITIAHYCVGVAEKDGFDIYDVVLNKIHANYERVWDPAKLNELVKRRS
jgi:hypothetical protein